MFFGEFTYKIDQKGRVPIPPRFRGVLQEGLVLAPGPEKCIVVRTIAEWHKLAQELTSSTISASKMRKLNRAIFATAFNTSLDGQGRVALPAALRGYAGITEDVVIAGVNNCLEIWDKQQWEPEKGLSQEQAWQIIESLEKR